uniref:Uncharacterized protein n=1 Tax=Arundo donax TaxID=35708 RepID=A0A0A9BMW1_ARUDO
MQSIGSYLHRKQQVNSKLSRSSS